MTQLPRIRIGPGATLAAAGSALAFDGERLAAGGAGRLTVWRGATRLAEADAPSPAPGTPRFAGERVYWGPGFVDLGSGSYTVLRGAQPARRPGAGARSEVHAWSPRGDQLLASVSTGDPRCPVRVTVFDGRTGEPAATLWEGGGTAPQAAWVGERSAVVGFSDPRVFDRSGRYVADVALGAGTVAVLAATADERRLIAVDVNRAIAWIDAESWTVLDRWPGPWLHGAVSPDGRFVAAIEPWGTLRVACVEGDRFQPAGEAAIDRDAVALALGADEIATAGGGRVHRASLRVGCRAAPGSGG